MIWLRTQKTAIFQTGISFFSMEILDNYGSSHLPPFRRTRLKKFSPRPRGKSVIGKILFEDILIKKKLV